MQWINSPLTIPLAAFVVAIVAIVGGLLLEAHRTRLRADQRLAMLARGVSVDDIERLLGHPQSEVKPVKDPVQSLINTRRTALILISSGIGMVISFTGISWVVGVHEALSGAALGFAPIMIGIGFWIDYKLQKRDLSRFGLEVERVD